jgi:hypothetical protein
MSDLKVESGASGDRLSAFHRDTAFVATTAAAYFLFQGKADGFH